MRRLIVTILLSILPFLSLTSALSQTVFASETNLTSGCVSLAANPSIGGVPLFVNFLGEGFDQGHSIGMYEFDFGDASRGQARTIRQTSSAASHRYYSPGTYTASLRVETSKGQFVGGGDCKKTIIVTNSASALGTQTSVNTLPKTGIKDYLGTLFILLILLGIYLRKHFKLS